MQGIFQKENTDKALKYGIYRHLPTYEKIIRNLVSFYNKKPILGVCLGHQAICEAFGSTITYAKELMHGKSSIIKMTDDLIFQGLKQQTKVARYHSLAVKRETLAKVLKAIALSEDGEVMAVKHIDYPVYGLQFHPESILTDDGKKMIENFLGVKEND